jgi:hypothetical protein
MDCAKCGAPLDSAATACAYCGSPSPEAERIRAEERARQDRATAQQAEGARRASAQKPVLDWATACALAEIYALKNGHAGEKGKNLVHFDCTGSLAGSPDRPMLDHFASAAIRATTTSTSPCVSNAAQGGS